MNTQTDPMVTATPAFTVSRYNTGYTMVLNGVSVAALTNAAPFEYYKRNPHLRIAIDSPSPAIIYLAETGLTIHDLAVASGLSSFDCALPYQWVQRDFLAHGLPFPRGVWSYDTNRTFGDFVSMDSMLRTIASKIVALVGADALSMLDHSAGVAALVAQIDTLERGKTIDLGNGVVVGLSEVAYWIDGIGKVTVPNVWLEDGQLRGLTRAQVISILSPSL